MPTPDRLLDELHLTIQIHPRGQGRARCVGRRQPVKAQEDRDYEKALVDSWAAQGRPRLHPGPYRLEVVAQMKRPDTHFRQDGSLTPEGERHPYPERKPDADNILKAVADALGGVAFPDDAQMVDCRARKEWAGIITPERIVIYAENLWAVDRG